MQNRRMEEKLKAGKAIDVSGCRRTNDGDYLLTAFDEDADYCDSQTEAWIWSIGKHRETGQIVASTSTRFYENPAYHCLFLR